MQAPLASQWRTRPETTFIGREADIAAVSALVTGGARFVTLTGPGGIGKTRLALEVAAALEPAFTDGTTFVPLAAVRDPTLVMDVIAEAVGARVDGRAPFDRSVERIGAARCLLMLDNLEWLTAAGPDLRRLLDACPGLQLLATSRVPVGVDMEQVAEVSPLPLPGASDAGRLRGNPAVQLFVDRARLARPGLALADDDGPRIAEICRRLDGIPLAIELAAARVTVLPPAAMLARLDRRLPLLTARQTDLPARHRTMRDAIAWSYDLLSPEEQAVFRRLSVFEGGFFLSAAERIMAGWSPGDGYVFAGGQRIYGQAWQEQVGKEHPAAVDGAWEPPALARLDVEAIATLERLAAHRMIRSVEPIDGDARFSMLETIREFGREQLEDAGEAPAIDHAHAALTLRDAEAAGWGMWGPDRRRWLARLEADLGNLRAAMAWLAAQPAPANQLSLRLADAPWNFWLTRGRVAEGFRYLDAALARPGGTATARATAANTAGYLALIQGDARRAKRTLVENLARCEATSFRLGEARCRFFLALVAWNEGDHQAMAAQAAASLKLFSAGQDWAGMGVSLIALSMIARGQGRLAEAGAMLTEAAERCAQAGFDWGVATCAYYRGEAARARGDDQRAVAWLREGLTAYRDQGDPGGMAGCLAALATVAATHGDDERAARLFAAAGKLGEGTSGFLPPSDRSDYETAAREVRERLGEQAFYAASGVGYAMPLEHVLAEAELVDGRSARARARPPAAAEASTAKSLGLTEAQFEVLRLIGQGLEVDEIAAQLSRAESSIYGRIERLKDRLRIQTDAELFKFAMERGVR